MTRRCAIIGHRGARGLWPENTLAGFIGALALGVDALEMDVGMTSDGVVVVTHDPSLNPALTRDAAGHWLALAGPAIRELTTAAVARYDVGRLRPGTAYAAGFPEQVPADGARIPTLTDALRLDPKARWIIELKTFPDAPGRGVAAPLLADRVLLAADSLGVTAAITVEGFDWRGPRHVRRTRPDVAVAWLTRAATAREATVWWGGPHPSDFGGSVPRAVAAEGGPTWGPDHIDLTAELVAEAHELGLAVVPWTVNAPADMRRLIGWGVDGVVTDRPDLARSVLAEAAPARSARAVSR